MKKRTRPIRISIRLSQQEHKKLSQLCSDTGLPVSTTVRNLLMGIVVKPKPPDSYKDLVRELAAIGNNINQITRLANSKGNVADAQIREVALLMAKVWELVQTRV